MDFQYYLPVNLHFGRGEAAKIGTLTSAYGKKALIVTGRNSTKKSGLLDKTIIQLKKAGVESVVFDRAEPNPLTTTAESGAALAKAEGCDVVIGLGGGSIMDCAKAVAFMAVNNGELTDYIAKIKTSQDALPILLVPTTCGTGSEGNAYAVLTNPANGDKRSLCFDCLIAKASIIDPECMLTMPKNILASVGFDALCHNMEGYISKNAQPMTDLMALSGIELLGKYLLRAYADYSDTEAWDNITWASTLGGMVIRTTGVTAAHGMEHPASGLKNIVHGKGLAALTPVIIEESIEAASEKFAVISRLLGGGPLDCADSVRKLLRQIGLEQPLSEQGVTKEDIPWMADNCLKVSAGAMQNHPVVFDREKIVKIYEKAL